MTEQEQIEAGMAALEAQRGTLGDAVVDVAIAAMRTQLQGLLRSVAAPAQQLKQVTVMFIDTVGSTAMGQGLDPEDVQAVIDGALERFTAIVQRFSGRVLQYAGDGLLAVFGADEAHEDDPERAIRAGLEVLAEAQRHATRVARDLRVTGFQVRVGINTGPVLLGGGVDAEGTIRGATVNLAARMEQSAPPGELRISHDSYRHVRGLFRVSEQPPLIVKGYDQPLATYLVQGVQPRAFHTGSRGIEGLEVRMVAREAEMELLQEAWGAVARKAAFSSVLVVAEAGLGKSRLLQEFERWVEDQDRPALVLRGRADPRAQSHPFGLLRDLLCRSLQISEEDDPATARRKFCEGLLPRFDMGAEEGEAHAHLLGHLIGLDFSGSPHLRGILEDGRQIRNRGFHAVAQMLRIAHARDGLPNLLLLDDLHWADDGSLDFVDYLLQVNRDVPTLMLGLTRPLLFERRADWAEGEATHQRIDLQPLDKRGSRELANVLLQRLNPVPPTLRELITGGAEGNPFYMEELLRMLIDEGAIAVQGGRWHLLPDKLQAAQVPPTLTGVLQARLDTLAPHEKLSLQQAAVIGFVFWDQALAALDAQALQPLDAQIRRGLVVPHDRAAFEGQNEYAFKHQILHQVTYDSLLRRSRREYHAKAAAWLVHLGESGASGLSQTLGPAAEHFERAGDMRNALSYFVRAAEDAAARYANEAMLGFVARGLALAQGDDHEARWRLLRLRERLLQTREDRAAHEADLQALAELAERLDDDQRRIEVLLRQAFVLRAAGDFEAAERADRAGFALAAGLPEVPPALFPSLATTLTGRGDYAGAREVSEQGLALARRQGDRVGESKLVNALGLIAMEQGDLATAADCFERGLLMVREARDRGAEGLRLNNLGSVYPRLGDYAKARQHLDQGLRLARALGQRDTEAVVLLNTGSVAHLQGDDTSALAHANAALEAAAASGQRDLEAYARLVAGHAELGLGRLEAAQTAYADSRDRLLQLKMRGQQVLDPVSGLARVALARGQVAEALRQVELILAHLAGGGSLDGTEEPLLLPLTCYQVLLAAGDVRALEVLAAAHAELQAQAARISDARVRQGFLSNVPHNREIVRAWEALNR
ncbi:adenylate/guanylate cyclase domain-containing protein [Roseateles toxinivorans]|uniref:Tetratricopeptide repeat protein n=1 Tax=Roseateles toxinivorans TaxID=270368 RepID=A0A4R6QJU7_9BURK|nr:adenylate/guanylate cyclase domain-containing protein [Roseateles toxinivorans]TDP63173.1 tetratricopeptide repeat protein [Roseateles toxinivorans]